MTDDTETDTNRDKEAENNPHKEPPCEVDAVPKMECPADGCDFTGVDRLSIQKHCSAMLRNGHDHPSWCEILDADRDPVWYCTSISKRDKIRYHTSVCAGLLEVERSVRSVPRRLMRTDVTECQRCAGGDWHSSDTGPSLADRLRSDSLRAGALEELGFSESETESESRIGTSGAGTASRVGAGSGDED